MFDPIFGIHNELNSCNYLECKDYKPTYFHTRSSCTGLAFPHPNELSYGHEISFDQRVCIMEVLSMHRIYETQL